MAAKSITTMQQQHVKTNERTSMSEQWYKDYALLAFRIDKAIHKFTDSPYVDAYYGPPEWKTMVETEPERPAADLVRSAMTLAGSLPAQGFDAQHVTYLGKQVLALETLCRKLNGETFALEDEVQRLYDIRPARIPETLFEQAHAIFDEVLPGDGSIFERRLALRRKYELPREKMGLLVGIMEQMMGEVCRRTQAFVELPEGEAIEIQVVSDKHYGGACWYLGNYRSHIDVNTDLPVSLNSLVNLVCHEGYPGHHTEAILKEQQLYRQRGHIDQAIVLLMSPHCLISEGIATLASEMIFAPGEIERWLAEQVYPKVGIETDDIDIMKLERAKELLEGVWGNAAFLLYEGRPDAEVMQYMLIPEEEVPKYVEFLKVPFAESYVFT